MDNEQRKKIIEATLMSASQALNVDQLLKLFADDADEVSRDDIKAIVQSLQEDCQERGYELKKWPVVSAIKHEKKCSLGLISCAQNAHHAIRAPSWKHWHWLSISSQ